MWPFIGSNLLFIMLIAMGMSRIQSRSKSIDGPTWTIKSWLLLGIPAILTLVSINVFLNLDGIPTRSLVLGVHIAGAIAGQVFAIAATCISVLYLLQRRILKEKLHDQTKFPFTPLQSLEKILLFCLTAGFVLISLALSSGLVYLDWGFSSLSMKTKLVWAVNVWVWYFIAIVLKHIFYFSTDKIASMCIGGFLLLSTFFFGISFLIS